MRCFTGIIHTTFCILRNCLSCLENNLRKKIAKLRNSNIKREMG